MSKLGIGELSVKSGVAVPNIRYYESIGLLPRPQRNEGGRRTYSNDDIAQLTYIRNARRLGFPIAKIKTMMGLEDQADASCRQLRDLATEQLLEMSRQISELQVLQRELQHEITTCDVRCCDGLVKDCTVTKAMSAH